MISVNPIELKGNWYQGFALDLHTLSSRYIGPMPFGSEYETVRSEVGELLYKLKYRYDESVIEDIVEVVSFFLKNEWRIADSLDGIIPVPPSEVFRIFQPVMRIVEALSENLHIPMYKECLEKSKETPALKGIFEYEKRIEILKNAFEIKNSDVVRDKDILLFDDLYRSGATLNILTQILYDQCLVDRVYVLTLTKTRISR